MVQLTRRQWGGFWAILAFALLVRLGAAWYWQEQLNRSGESFRFGDSQSYWIMASNIARGGPYQFGSEHSRIFRAPLYPLLLAPWTWIGPDNPSPYGVWFARCMGCALGTLAVGWIMMMTRLIACPNVSLLAGLLASIYPGAVAMSIFVLSEAIATPLLLLSCSYLLLGLRSSPHRAIPYLAAGIFFGLVCLARPSWSLWPMVAIVYWMLAAKPGTCHETLVEFRSVTIFCAAAIAIMSPWWIRNYSMTGKFVPTTLQVGASLYDGWHPGASGSSDENMDFVNKFIVAQRVEDEMLATRGIPLESTLEWRIDRRMRREAVAWAAENPSDVIRLSLVKLVKMWSPLPVAEQVQPLIRWAEGLGYMALILGAVAGAWRLRREKGAWFAWMPCLYLAMLHTIFIGSVRYRQPAVLLLCPLAAVGWMVVIEWIRKRGSKATQRQIDSA